MEAESRKRKRRGGGGKNRKKSQNKAASVSEPFTLKKLDNPDGAPESSQSKPGNKSSNFLVKMKARLTGGHFRMINEKLYTCTTVNYKLQEYHIIFNGGVLFRSFPCGNEALKYFRENPSLFNLYHTGYQEQMSHWPQLPVNVIIRWLKDHSPALVVADFGCGDARLAKSVKNKVYSIDLVSSDPSVIVCDMSKTPLGSSSVDVAVFCLSLMGTDFPSYLQEALRVLKPSGWLLIAEVKSRFDPNTGGADPNKFSKAICGLGFTSVSKDFSNKMFIMLYFKKKDNQQSDAKGIQWPELKPCLYKRR